MIICSFMMLSISNFYKLSFDINSSYSLTEAIFAFETFSNI